MEPRSNGAWIEALQGEGEACAAAVRNLEGYLGRVLGKAVGGRLGEEAVAELVQESVVRIVQHLSSFRGDSAFTTWAAGIATRVAFTELRRRNVRERAFDEVVRDAGRPAPAPDEALSRADLLQSLERAIATCLTERQRTAILAELRGIPTVEIAARLDTSQNALYKLTHDARRKLRAALLDAGFTAESLGRPEGPR